MAYKTSITYRGDAHKATRHDQINFDLATEQAGVGGTGKSRNDLDAGVGAKGKLVKAKGTADTTGFVQAPYDATKNINPSVF